MQAERDAARHELASVREGAAKLSGQIEALKAETQAANKQAADAVREAATVQAMAARAEQLAAELAEARKDHRELIALVKGEGAAPEAAQPATTRKGNPGKKA